MLGSDESLPFGPLLGVLRRRHGQSQDDLASHLGCKRTYVSQLERNLKIPSNSHLNRLILALALLDKEAEELTVAAEISRGTLDLPVEMPLSVRRQLVRLIRHRGSPSLGSWAALERDLARIAPVSE